MADRIRVRIYNVRFGDAILVRVPDRDPATGETTRRHILIDVGNVLRKEGGDDTVFEAIVKNVLEQLDGEPLDLYVMTHEHLDHVQGLFHASKHSFQPDELKTKLATRFAWLTGSAAPDYYDTHPNARREKKLYAEAYARIGARLALLPAAEAEAFAAMYANNNPQKTADCVAFLRSLAETTTYVHRGKDLDGTHPFREARFEIWAPEEDTASYYKSLMPLAIRAGGAAAGPAARSVPPPGVDTGAFYDLVSFRERGFADNLLAIDKAANDTSVVFCLEWRGNRLLFAGDAELDSWRMMAEKNVLGPVDFLKVSHHGSHNGTPDADVLDRFLPSGGKRRAVISTWTETYGGIPHEPTNDKLRARARLRSILDDPDALFFDTFVSAKG
jgi:beta-lactamase superfamily II metal-dependent hydrolase